MDRDVRCNMYFETSPTLIPAHGFMHMARSTFKRSTHEISGSHSGESEDDSLLGCCTV
jgi:hypothetical protein